MAKRKPKDGAGAGRKPPQRTGEPLNVWVRSELMAAVRSLLANTTPRTSKTAVVELALEMLLRERGYWPPPGQSPPSKE